MTQKHQNPEGTNVLLTADVRDLGYLGDIVMVKRGYARNYLLPQKLGVVPTEANIKVLAEAKAKASAVRKVRQERLAKAVAAVEGAEVVVAAKANETGRLFGSIGPDKIAENLRDQGFEVHDSAVEQVHHIKETGTHEITLKFEAGLTAKISVVVVSEDKQAEMADGDPADEKPDKNADEKPDENQAGNGDKVSDDE